MQLRTDYFAMLSENKSLHYKSKWKDVKSSFRQDPRYQAVEHSSQREEWFQEHVKKLEKVWCNVNHFCICSQQVHKYVCMHIYFCMYLRMCVYV